MILVDSSIWVEFFRKDSYRAELETLLYNRQLATHSYLVAEIALGQLAMRQQTLEGFDSLPTLPTVSVDDVRHMIEARSLYGKGIGFVDANLLASCLATPGAKLWTLDKRLGGLAGSLGICADYLLTVN